MTYRIFGDLVDGTYLGIDASHAHMNMPATLMWARGFEGRPARVTFTPPAGSGWKPATQLFPTPDAVDLYRAEHAIPVRQPDRAERPRAA